MKKRLHTVKKKFRIVDVFTDKDKKMMQYTFFDLGRYTYIMSCIRDNKEKTECEGNMENLDTIRLLKECDAGTKMGVASIDDVLERVTNSELKDLLQESKAHHKELESEINTLLSNMGKEEKEPSAMAKGMSKMKTNMKMYMDNSDATVADLITDGCDMGVKSLYRYLNQYKAADEKSKEICHKLIDIEELLRKELRVYL